MKKSWLRHSFEFLLVFAVLIVALILLEIFRNTWSRLLIIVFVSIFYVVIGVFHHWEEKNLTWKVFAEHLAIGIMMFLVLQGIYK